MVYARTSEGGRAQAAEIGSATQWRWRVNSGEYLVFFYCIVLYCIVLYCIV
jgi:hypothetical protein